MAELCKVLFNDSQSLLLYGINEQGVGKGLHEWSGVKFAEFINSVILQFMHVRNRHALIIYKMWLSFKENSSVAVPLQLTN